MASPSRKKRLNKLCNITRLPVAGQSSTTAVATNLACSVVYPAGDEVQQRLKLATMVQIFEVLTAAASVESQDVLTTEGRTFHIIHAAMWQSSRTNHPTTVHIVMEEVIA